MSVYTTVKITREDAIKQLMAAPKTFFEMTNEELADAMFNRYGREELPNTRLENYMVVN